MQNERLSLFSGSETFIAHKVIENIQFAVCYRQIDIIRSSLIWTSRRPRLKIWAYGLKFLGTPKRPLIKTLIVEMTMGMGLPIGMGIPRESHGNGN